MAAARDMDVTEPVDVRAVPPKGTSVLIEPDEGRRAALARALDVVSVDALRAELLVRPWGGDGMMVEGEIRASVVQRCVVTLDPVAADIVAPVEATFAPEGSPLLAGPDALEFEVDMEAADPPEPFDGRSIDLGAVVAEFLSLALDPYPRRAGAELPDAARDASTHPFAALSALKAGK